MLLNELTRPDDIDYVLTRGGYKRLGSGMFATVYEKPGVAYVLKVFSVEDHAYLDFIKLAREHQDNPHFPKFYGKLVRINKSFYGIRMERLSRFDPHKFGDVAYELFDYIQDGIGSVLDNDPELKDACDLVRKNLLTKYHFDNKNDACMVRGNIIVITDPVLDLYAKELIKQSPLNMHNKKPKWTDDDDRILAQLSK